MNAMLSFGSAGPLVAGLQKTLNLLPTDLVLLKPDGIFGSKTKGRVQEFQGVHELSPDGIVGPLTWQRIVDLFEETAPVVIDPEVLAVLSEAGIRPLRQRIADVAREEASRGGVTAKQSDGRDPANKRFFRNGREKLLKYFRLAAPDPKNFGRSLFNEQAITHMSAPSEIELSMPHWCGIFALWAIKTAGLPVGTWPDFRNSTTGISLVPGFRNIPSQQVRVGDVGFVNNGFEHHFIIEKVLRDEGVVLTVEGNSVPNSTFSFKRRPINSVSAYYTVFPRLTPPK